MDTVLIMESKEKELKMHRTHLLRKFERYCKSVNTLKDAPYIERFQVHAEYNLIRTICIDLKVLTEEQITEHENEMKRHYDKNSKK